MVGPLVLFRFAPIALARMLAERWFAEAGRAAEQDMVERFNRAA